MDNKYIDGKIYEIISDNTDMVYIGSCIITLKKRLIEHKRKKNKCSSKFIIDCGDYDIYLIEKYSCNNNLELRMREQMYIDIYKNDGKNVINGKNAYTSIEDTKENRKNYDKDRKEYFKEYRKNNKENIKEYYQRNKEDRKQWNKDNRKKQQEYYKEYYKNNKERKAEYDKERGLFRSKKVCNGFYNLSMMLNEY